MEHYCPKGNVGTYNGKYPDGSKSYGGYADHCRMPALFAVPIPDGISSAEAAPMMCGGVTVWSPLVKNGAGPGKRVGSLEWEVLDTSDFCKCPEFGTSHVLRAVYSLASLGSRMHKRHCLNSQLYLSKAMLIRGPGFQMGKSSRLR
jgi:hypothetical protein